MFLGINLIIIVLIIELFIYLILTVTPWFWHLLIIALMDITRTLSDLFKMTSSKCAIRCCGLMMEALLKMVNFPLFEPVT